MMGAGALGQQTGSLQATNGLASQEQILTSYEGQNVVRVEIAGRPDATLAQFGAAAVQQSGQPFSKDKVDQSRTAIKASSACHCTDVRVGVEPETNGVRVQFILEPAIYFGIYSFPGAERFSYSRLLQAADYPIQRPFDAEDVEQGRQDLVRYFQQEGFFEAQAAANVQVDAQHRLANVVFHCDLKRKARFGTVEIEGTTPNQAEQLRGKLSSKMARLRGAAVRPRKAYHNSTLTRSTQYLQSTLQKQDFLSAQVHLQGAQYESDNNRADVHFQVKPGDKTHVNIEGAHLWSWTKKSLLPAYQGAGVDQETVLEGEQALVSYFQAKGFFDVTVQSNYKTTPGNAVVSYQITKGKKHKVTSVDVAGNKQLPASKLAPSIAVQKKHVLSSGKFSDQLVQSSVKNLKAVYQSEGFSEAKVTPSVQRSKGNISVRFTVVEGPRDTVNSLSIEGAQTFPQSQFAPKGLELAVGQPYSQSRVQADRKNIVARYLEAGYLNVSFHETVDQVSKQEPHRINVIYHIDEGPRVFAADLLTLGRKRTQQKLINMDTTAIVTGKPLTESGLLRAGSHLYDQTGVFDWAEVDPKEQITTQTKEDVLIKVHEAQRNDFTYGLGFEVINRGGSIPSGTVALPNLPPIGLPSSFTTSEVTYYGPRGSFQYTRNNLRGKGESLSVTGFAGRLDQRGAIYYIDPNFRWSVWTATTSFSAERDEENPIFSSQQETASLQVQRPIDRSKKNTFFLRYSFNKTDLTRVLIPALVPTADQHVRLSEISANVTRDTRDNALDEHRGVLNSIDLDFNSTKLGSSVDFAKMTGQAAFYTQKFHGVVWADSVRIGLAPPFSNSRVPLSEEFFTGGGNSLRGFPLDGAGMQRQVTVCSSGSSSACSSIQVPTGGRSMLILNSEARIPLPIKKGLSIVPFYDGGNVFPAVGFHDFTSLYSNNVGIGLRYSTPVGPIRFDIGRNLNPITGIDATQYFVSIGQAF
jgi:outer membrane protein insertion porin family